MSYSKICIKRLSFKQRKGVSEKRFNLSEVFYEKTKKGDFLIYVTAWTGLTVYRNGILLEFKLQLQS